jgi:hypothetical protein
MLDLIEHDRYERRTYIFSEVILDKFALYRGEFGLVY